MKAYWGNGGIAPLTPWPWHYIEVSCQLYALAALPSGKDPWHISWAPRVVLGAVVKRKMYKCIKRHAYNLQDLSLRGATLTNNRKYMGCPIHFRTLIKEHFTASSLRRTYFHMPVKRRALFTIFINLIHTKRNLPFLQNVRHIPNSKLWILYPTYTK